MSFTLERAGDLLERSRRNGRLAHAYLITGPEGSGKEELAIRAIEMVSESARMAGAESITALAGSNVAVVRPESKSRRITVDAIRAAEHTLQMAAPDGVTKFAVIVDADRMGPEAENAFLKTLEEPPAASRLLLLTARPEMLLDTILSRCIRIPLQGSPTPPDPPPAAHTLLERLSEHATAGDYTISRALGLMACFSSLLKQEKAAIAKQNEESLKAETVRYQKASEGDYLKRREEYYKALTEAEYLARRARFIEYLAMWFGDALRHQNGSPHLDLPGFAEATADLARAETGEQLIRRIRAIEDLRSHLQTNVFEALALESAFIRAFA